MTANYCCDTCACRGTEITCISLVDPVRFGFFSDWCRGTDEAKRRHVLGRSRIGLTTPTQAVSAPLVDRVPSRLAGIPLAGDVVEALAKKLGADRLAKWWESKTGMQCGCAERREKMNRATRTLLNWAGLSNSWS